MVSPNFWKCFNKICYFISIHWLFHEFFHKLFFIMSKQCRYLKSICLIWANLSYRQTSDSAPASLRSLQCFLNSPISSECATFEAVLAYLAYWDGSTLDWPRAFNPLLTNRSLLQRFVALFSKFMIPRALDLRRLLALRLVRLYFRISSWII